MNTFFSKYAWVFGLCALVLFGLWQLAWLVITPQLWQFKPGPPVPLQILPSWSRYSGDCDLQRCARVTMFDSALTPEELETFYRKELDWRGWRYHCTAGAGLSPCLITVDAPGIATMSPECTTDRYQPACASSPPVERVLVFDRGGAGTRARETVEVAITAYAGSGMRVVRVVEWPAAQVGKPQPAATAAEPLRQQLIGDWQGNDSDGVGFLLRFHEREVVTVARGSLGAEGITMHGTYRLNSSATKLQLRVKQTGAPSERVNCRRFPPFLQPDCDSSRGLDNALALQFDGDTLVLVRADGRSISLSRQGK